MSVLRDGDFAAACNVFAFLAEIGDCESFKDAESVLWNIQKRTVTLHRLIVATETATRRMTRTTLLLKAVLCAPSAVFVRRVIHGLRDEPDLTPDWSMSGKLGYRMVSAAVSEGLVDGALELLRGGCPAFYGEKLVIKERGRPKAEYRLPRCLFGAANISSPDGRFAICDLLHVPELVEEVNAQMPGAMPALLGAAAADGAIEIVQTMLERGIVHPDCTIQRNDFTAIGQRRPAFWDSLEYIYEAAGGAEPWAELTPGRLLLLHALRRSWRGTSIASGHPRHPLPRSRCRLREACDSATRLTWPRSRQRVEVLALTAREKAPVAPQCGLCIRRDAASMAA